jgi:hypothetical protein
MQGIVSFYFTSMMIAVAVAAYLLPTVVAWLRHAPDIAAVMIINLTLGWTVPLARTLRSDPRMGMLYAGDSV